MDDLLKLFFQSLQKKETLIVFVQLLLNEFYHIIHLNPFQTFGLVCINFFLLLLFSGQLEVIHSFKLKLSIFKA